MKEWLFDLLGFFFPAYCPVCGDPIHQQNALICFTCEQKIPRTNFTDEKENPVAELFWGRTKLEGATALFRFEKGSAYQALIHRLKYNGEKRIGHFLGILLGNELKGTPFDRADIIIPVPLHRKKKRKRGFNQSEIIAKGVSEITGIPIDCNILFREKYSASQTNKGRFERWQNMHHIFKLTDHPDSLKGSSVILIDDVITTGSTIEGCAETLHQVPGLKIYAASVACA